jgi:MazG family protein
MPSSKKSASKSPSRPAARKSARPAAPAATSRPKPKAAGAAASAKAKARSRRAPGKALPVDHARGADQLVRLLEIMERLRRPGDGCPWDLEQSLDTLKPFLIEEAYEALDAMESGNREHLAEELGDVLLQIVFQSQIASEEGSFRFADVAQGISDKLVRRHPHVFGEVQVADSKEVLRNWEAIKKDEKKARESALDGVPKHVPPLHRAIQIQKRAARVGFDWSDVGDVYAKIAEELDELKEAVAKGDRKHVVEELGDLLFSVANVARFVKVDPAHALSVTNAKFERRFRIVESEIVASGRRMKDCTLAEMDEIWSRLRAEDKR